MKREEILAMEAGIELDALVAEKVMGECKHDYKVVGPNVWNHQCQNCGIMDSNFSQSTLYLVGTDKEYSTDISAAWEVVGKFKCYELSGIIFHTCKLWKTISQESFEYQGKSAPEAICKAALLTVLEGKIYET